MTIGLGFGLVLESGSLGHDYRVRVRDMVRVMVSRAYLQRLDQGKV